ncbi:MAG: ATP-binding protein [Bryobacteraceae bacterium]
MYRLGMTWRRIAVLTAAVGAVVLFILARPPQQFDPARVYKIGYDHNPPFQIRTPGNDGHPRGVAVDTVRAAARRAGIKLDWVLDQSRTAESLRDRKVDLWPLLTDVPERRVFAYLSDPWIVSDSYLIASGQSGTRPPPGFSGVIDYAGPKLYEILIHREWPRAQIREIRGLTRLAEMLCSGQSPLVFISSHQANGFMRDVSEGCPDSPLEAHHLPEITVKAGVASTFESARVADRLRAEILQMGEEGDLGGILARYAYVGLTETRAILALTAVERQSRQRTVAMVLLALAMALLAWLAWHLRRARKIADEASAAKSEFLAKMSHEIRTPLGGVIGMLELSLDAPLAAGQRENLETAHQSAKALLEILNDILDLSKIEAGRLEIAPTDVDVRQLVSSVSRLMAPVAQAKGLEFAAAVDSAVPRWIRVDPVRVKQVLLNLVGNAVKFTAEGSVEVRVGFSDPANGKSGDLEFRVRDTGIGIPEAKHSRLFVAFSQADDSTARKYGGTGLGLTISRQLVRMMHGEIWFESAPGVGSVFAFSIPFEQAAGPPPAGEPIEPVISAPRRILVAEDNRVNQKLIAALLERDGHTVTMAASGSAALDAVKANPPFDLVFMDIQMPEMDGFQATAAIRSLDSAVKRHVPIIALTAHAQLGYEEVCRTAGMDGYLTKPIDRAALRGAIARHPAPTPVAM